MTKPALLFIAFSIALLIQGGRSKSVIVVNNCGETVWPAIASFPGTSNEAFQSFRLEPSDSIVLNTQGNWNGRIWARTYCSTDASGTLVCLTGNCAVGLDCANSSGVPPATLVEFILQDDDEKDYYDVSLMHGFNLPVSVYPHGKACSVVSCLQNINAWCPQVLQVKGPDGSTVVGCHSACTYFKSDQYCCRGDYDSPSTCQPSSFSQAFKNLCPQSRTYLYDLGAYNLECREGTEYDIIFCP